MKYKIDYFTMNGSSISFDNASNSIFYIENGIEIDINNIYKSLDIVLDQLYFVVNILESSFNFPKSKIKGAIVKIKKYFQSLYKKKSKLSEFILGKDFYSYFISNEFDKFNNHNILDIIEINDHLLDYKINEILNFVKERLDLIYSRLNKYYKIKLSDELYNFNEEDKELYELNLTLLNNKLYDMNKKIKKLNLNNI